jgi:hypothetical protein
MSGSRLGVRHERLRVSNRDLGVAGAVWEIALHTLGPPSCLHFRITGSET